MNRFQRSWFLFKTSFGVIAKHPRLLVFPILVFLLTLLMLGVFVVPVALHPTGHSYFSREHWEALSQHYFHSKRNPSGGHTTTWTGLSLGYFVGIYFASMFLATFCNVAFYHEILEALGGRAVSLLRGFQFAGSRIGSIFMWTLLAASVGLLLKFLEQKADWLGRLILRGVGLVWNVAVVFAVPVLVHEEATTNPIQVLRRSVDHLRRTWGESLIGYVGLSLGGAVVTLIILGGFISAAVLGLMTQSLALFAVLALVWFAVLLAFNYVLAVAGHVYRGALYLYAVHGQPPAPFDSSMLNDAWRHRRQ